MILLKNKGFTGVYGSYGIKDSVPGLLKTAVTTDTDEKFIGKTEGDADELYAGKGY